MKTAQISNDTAPMECLPATERFALAFASDDGSDDLRLARALMLIDHSLEHLAVREGRSHKRA